MGNNTVEKWQKYSKSVSIMELISSVSRIPEFQSGIADIINNRCPEGGNVIEIGCEFGITSLMLRDDINKDLLDFDTIALKKAKKIFEHYKKKANFLHQDMFSMELGAKKYDIIFNAGVLEHFSLKERTMLLKEYSKYLKDDGIMLIAVPNHYSFLYRTAYLLLNLAGKWSFPKEYMIYNMSTEIKEANLDLISRTTIDKKNIFSVWGPYSGIVGKLLPIVKEGYLTVLEIQKNI